MYKWLFLIFLATITFNATAQLPSSLRSKTFITDKSTLTIDSLSLIPGSVTVFDASSNQLLDSNTYAIDYAKSLFLWKGFTKVELRINYKVFPLLFSKNYFHKDVRLLQERAIDNRKYFTYTPPAQNNTLFSLDGLNKSGSISRGIMFGNNQNLSVNSNMVLQMAGKIGNNIDVLAAISDDNLPIQPEGNTQQLNEFDRVFIQLKRDSTTLTAGDFELKRPNSYFMNFYKRTQGGMINQKFKDQKGNLYATTIAAAVAKGRSSRNNIIGQEGNQGPYRLTGNNSETFVVVIAGTERVYLDGVILARGQDNDYVIDYNTAELTFTAKHLITQNSRIAVEFEYTDKNYSRSLTYINQEIKLQKSSFRLNYYNEKDNRNQPFLQTLSDDQKQYLSGIGTNISQAFYPNVTEVEFNTNEVLYQQVTLPSGVVYYQYSIDPLLAKYRLGFSYVGENKGNYQLNTQSATNGKAYQYVAPIAGVLQGNYEPITLLVTPKQMQMISVGADFKPHKNTFFSSELAVSNNNVNLFAPKAEANSIGYGLQLKGDNTLRLNENNLLLKTTANYELVTKNFKPIERYRTIEFSRDFNLDGLLTPTDEHLINANIQLFKSAQNQISYGLNALIRKENYQGFQHKISTIYQLDKYLFKYDGSALSANSNLNKGDFYKQYFDLSRPVFNLTLGVVLDQQYNQTVDKITENLTGSSFSWSIYKVYLQSKADKQNKFKLDYSYRQDRLPRADELLKSSTSQSVNAGIDLAKNQNSVLSLTAGYRKTSYQNNFVNSNADENLVGRLD